MKTEGSKRAPVAPNIYSDQAARQAFERGELPDYHTWLAQQKALHVKTKVYRQWRRTIIEKTIVTDLADAYVTIGTSMEEVVDAKQIAPSIGWWILALTCSRDQLDAIAGDIEEGFARYARERGHAAAHWWFWIQIVTSFAHLAVRAVQKALPIADLFKKLNS